MGQYYKGSKIGTCESMYYMRLEEAEELAKKEERDDDGIKFSDYLKDGNTKFRFPFPDEDGKGSEVYYKEYNRSFKMPIGNIEILHDTICVSNSFSDKTHNMNIMIPCPYSADFQSLLINEDGGRPVTMSYGGAGEQWIDVVMEGYREDEDGKVKRTTIFECSRCHHMQRTDSKTMQKMKKRAKEHYETYKPIIGIEGKEIGGNKGLYEYSMKVLERMQ